MGGGLIERGLSRDLRYLSQNVGNIFIENVNPYNIVSNVEQNLDNLNSMRGIFGEELSISII